MFRKLLTFLLPIALISCANMPLPDGKDAIASQAEAMNIDLTKLKADITYGDLVIKFEQGNVSVLGGNIAAVPAPNAPAPPTPATMVVAKPSYGVYSNPPYNSSFTTINEYTGWDAGWDAAFAKAAEMRVDHQFLMLPWGACEQTVGVYLCDALIARFVEDAGPDLPLWFNLSSVVTGGARSVPSTLSATAWDDPAMRTAYKNFITHVAPLFKGRMANWGVGNEVNQYFSTHTGEIAAYGTFLGDVRTHARTKFGSNPFRTYVSFEYAAAGSLLATTYLPMVQNIDAIGYTYYAFGTDCLTDCTNSLLNQLLLAAGYASGLGKAYLYQEFGFSTAASLGGSETGQLAFIQTAYAILNAISEAGYNLVGVTWFTLYDQDEAIMALSFAPPLDDFFAYIGLRGLDGNAKEGYTALCNIMGGVNCDVPPLPVCTFSLSPTSAAHPAGALSATNLTITTQTGCAWSLSVINGTPAWFAPSATSGTGTTTITYTLTANTSTEGRSLTLTVGGLTWSLTQEGAVLPPPPPPACTYTLAASSGTFTASSGSDTVGLTTNNTGCAWVAQELDGEYDWFSVTATSGTGNATLTYSVLANTGFTSRVARFSVGPVGSLTPTIFTVTQDGAEPPDPDPDPDPVVACTSTTTSPTGRTPLFNWTPCRQDTMNRGYAESLGVNATSVAARYWKLTLANATGQGSVYNDLGQWAASMYQVTGNAQYAETARTKLLGRLNTINGLLPYFDSNIPRDEGIRYLQVLDKIKHKLTAPQEAEIVDGIADMFEVWTATNRIGDSDELVGKYFSLVMFHLLYPNEPRATALYNLSRTTGDLSQRIIVGGLVPARASNAVVGFLDGDVTMREMLRRYVEVHAEGGEWFEAASLYNPGTTRYLFHGADAVKTATGVDYFPEITAWAPLWADRLLMTFSPDLLRDFQWGDDQDPETLVKYRYALNMGTTMGMLPGTKRARQLQDLFLSLVTKYGQIGGGGQTMMPCCAADDGWFMWFYDPYLPRDDWRTSYSFFGKGAGVLVAREGFNTTDSFFTAATFPKHIATAGTYAGYSDPPDHFSFGSGNFMLWKNGEYVIDHPFDYAGVYIPGEGINSALIHGFGSAAEYKYDNVAASTSTTHACMAGTTGGSMQQPTTPATSNPAGYATVIAHELTSNRCVLFGTTDTIVTHDRMNIGDLVQPERYTTSTEYFGFTYNISQRIANKKAWVLHMPVTPTTVGSATSWTTPGGQSVKWTTLLPASHTKTLFDENAMAAGTQTPCAQIFGASTGCEVWAGGQIQPSQRKYHIKLFPTTNDNWHTFLNVIQTGTQGVVTLTSANGAEGAHITRPTQEDALFVFNGTQGPNLTTTPYNPTKHNAALAVVRFRGTGYGPLSWTAVGTSTLVFLEDLDPTATWTLAVDGGAANAIVPDAAGEYRTTVAGTGAHSITVVGSGAAPPPDPVTCATITIASALDNGTVGSVYSDSVSASGGTGPYTYRVSIGTLPPGLSLSSAGALTGTPTLSGSYSFTIEAKASDNCVGTAAYTVTIDPQATLAIARSGTPTTFSNMSGSVSSITVAITVPAGSNRLGVLYLMGGGSDTLTSCALNGSALTLITKVQVPGDLWIYALRLVAPTVGTTNLVCTFSANTTIAGEWFGYTGVNQTTPILGTPTSTTSTSTTAFSLTQTPSLDNAWTVMVARAWTALNAGLGSNTVIGIDAFGMKAFDFGPHVFPTGGAPPVRTMQATTSFAVRGGALMFTLNPIIGP